MVSTILLKPIEITTFSGFNKEIKNMLDKLKNWKHVESKMSKLLAFYDVIL